MPGTPRPIAVIDIDGVVADVRHRLHHIERRPKDWHSFFLGAVDDPPISEGVDRVRSLLDDHEVVYLTGRPEWLRDDTERWLARHGIGGRPLVMRGNRDHRPARRTKVDELRRISELGEIVLVLDDDPDVCAEVTAAGWPVEMAQWVPHGKTLHQAQEKDGRT